MVNNKIRTFIIFVLVIMIFTAFYQISVRLGGDIIEATYTRAKDNPKTIGAEGVAEAILNKAGIKHTEAFIYKANDSKNVITVLYENRTPISKYTHHYIDVYTGDVDASSFVNDYFVDNAFCSAYNTLIEWDFEKTSVKEYSAHLSLMDEVEDTVETYEKMRQRDLVIDSGLFVAILGAKLNIPVYESFVVIDDYTRMEGWLCFKTIVDNKHCVACLGVYGWDGDTTYEELVNGSGFYVDDINAERILVAKRD